MSVPVALPQPFPIPVRSTATSRRQAQSASAVEQQIMISGTPVFTGVVRSASSAPPLAASGFRRPYSALREGEVAATCSRSDPDSAVVWEVPEVDPHLVAKIVIKVLGPFAPTGCPIQLGTLCSGAGAILFAFLYGSRIR